MAKKRTLSGICKVCGSLIETVLEVNYQSLAYDKFMRTGVTCSNCGTYFRAYEVIDRYEVTGFPDDNRQKLGHSKNMRVAYRSPNENHYG